MSHISSVLSEKNGMASKRNYNKAILGETFMGNPILGKKEDFLMHGLLS